MPEEPTYRILDIRRGTTVDGPGLRTSIYMAGCRHACPGCHNPDSWDPRGGTPMSLSSLLEIISDEDFDVTLTGGDPLWLGERLIPLVEAIKAEGKNLWLYTGFTIHEIRLSPLLRRVVRDIDTIVEGRFVNALRDPDLRFRGSSNQRIVDLKAPSLKD